jgi:queuine/archaeosine tRNA-ribosyltransferase
MGLGSPADLLEAVHAGVDLFDSVLPARVARNGQLWIPGERLNIRNQRISTIRPRSRTTVRASSAGASRGRTLPICSVPTSCSRTASQLVTTSPSP